MNYLAHVYLARHSDDAMLGALLSDFVGTAGLPGFSPVIQREIRLHWKFDSYTDHHPAVLAMRARFPEGRRRYAGIALDIYFDHLIARDWSRYLDQDLDDFTAHFYEVLLAHLHLLPERLRALAPRMAEYDWLGSYRDRDNVDFAVSRVATRLSRNGGKLVECLPLLREHEAFVEARFGEFFPELVSYMESLRLAEA